MLRVVKTANGFVEGLPAADPRITSFKGIPFAAPPIGENRWKAPQPAENWDETLLAYTFAPISMQNIPGLSDDVYTKEWNVDPEIPMDEDCLYLNVWTPAKSPDEKLPVLVWFFGGGLQVGNTAEMEFDGERLARRGIVVVTVNYRLNIFGFLTTGEIVKNQPDAPANWGMLDQQAGLKWVQENIAAFGGDPDCVTIAGQSAGGGSVMSHLTSPQSRGLFHKVIVESGVLKSCYGAASPGGCRSLEDGIRLGEDFFRFIGAENVQQAREMDAEFLRDKYLEYKGFFGTLADGVFCVGDSYDLYMKDQKAPVPMLAGLTADEFHGFLPKVETQEEYIAMTEKFFGPRAEEFRNLCAKNGDSLEELLKGSDSRPIELAIRSMFEKNNGKEQNYMYYFDTFIPGPDAPGNFHSVDLWFFFETLAKCWRPFTGAHYDEARLMCNYWANFIKYGDPNGKDADGEDMPLWEAYTADSPYYMVFSDKNIGMRKEPADELTRFLVDTLKERYE